MSWSYGQEVMAHEAAYAAAMRAKQARRAQPASSADRQRSARNAPVAVVEWRAAR
jgi:hypothetical protein